MEKTRSVKPLVLAVIRADPSAVQGASSDAQGTRSDAEASTPTSTLFGEERGVFYSIKKHKIPADLVLESGEADAVLPEIVASMAAHPAFAQLQASATGRDDESLKLAFVECCHLIRARLDVASGTEASDADTGKAGFFVVSEHAADVEVSDECRLWFVK